MSVVCEALGLDLTVTTLSHFLVFDKEGDQLTTEIVSASKFWKISSFSDTTLRVFTNYSGVGDPDATSSDQRKAVDSTNATSSNLNAPMNTTDGSDVVSVSVAHARHPRRECTVFLRVGSSWSSITEECSKALKLDNCLSIAYILAFDREDRKFGSPMSSSDRFWKNISYYSHHVLRMFTVASTKALDPTAVNSYRVALSTDPDNYKIIPYNAVPSMDDIRNAVSATFCICSDIVLHVVFMDTDGDALSGPLNSDSKLMKFFHHKDACIRVFTNGPAVTILPRYRFLLETANGPPQKGAKYVTLSRNPTWEELKIEVSEELELESSGAIDHVVFLGK